MKVALAAALSLACITSSAVAGAQAPAPPPEVTPPPDQGAEPPPEPPKDQKMNGVYADLSLGIIGLGYERVFGESFALNLVAHYYRPWYKNDHLFGFGGELRPFIFFTDTAPEGVYVSPGLRLDYATADIGTEDNPEGLAWGTRFTVGYGAVVAKVVALRLGLGVQAHSADLVEGTGDPDIGGAYPAIDLYIGPIF